VIGKFEASKWIPEETRYTPEHPRFKLYQSSAPLEVLIQRFKETADGHESLFNEIVGDKNVGLAIYCWNSLFLWVDIETRLLKCYDMEYKATTIFEAETSKMVEGLSLSIGFIQDELGMKKGV
jgi:hypothetical protein